MVEKNKLLICAMHNIYNYRFTVHKKETQTDIIHFASTTGK